VEATALDCCQVPRLPGQRDLQAQCWRGAAGHEVDSLLPCGRKEVSPRCRLRDEERSGGSRQQQERRSIIIRTVQDCLRCASSHLPRFLLPMLQDNYKQGTSKLKGLFLCSNRQSSAEARGESCHWQPKAPINASSYRAIASFMYNDGVDVLLTTGLPPWTVPSMLLRLARRQPATAQPAAWLTITSLTRARGLRAKEAFLHNLRHTQPPPLINCAAIMPAHFTAIFSYLFESVYILLEPGNLLFKTCLVVIPPRP
jgi:hypothetical protein